MADLMEIDGPEYYLQQNTIYDPSAEATPSPIQPIRQGERLPTIRERREPPTPTAPQFPSQPATRSRKRGFEAAFAAENTRTIDHQTVHPNPTRSSGMLTTIYQYARGAIASFLGYSTPSQYEKEILAVKTGNKRRAIAADLSPSKLTAKLPGAFPMAEEKEVAPAVRTKDAITKSMPDAASKTETAPAVRNNVAHVTATTTTKSMPDTAGKTEAVPAVQLETPPVSRPSSSHENHKHDSSIADRAPWLFQPSKPATHTEKVVRLLPPPTFKDTPAQTKRRAEIAKMTVSPTLVENARKDAEINLLIEKSKRNLFPKPEQGRMRDERMRGRFTRFVSDPDSYAVQLVEERISDEQERLYNEQQFKAKITEQRAKAEARKEARAAELKAEQQAMKAKQEAIEQLLQEEAAKQAELMEEEKKQEELRKALEEQAKIGDPEYIRKQKLIRPLDPEWDIKLDAEMAVKSKNHVIIKTVDGTDLTRKDFGTLLPQEGSGDNVNGWLNDEIVNGWMSCIVARKLEQTGYVKSNKNVPAYVAMSSAWFSNYKKRGGIENIARWSQRKGIKGKKLLECEKVFFPINTGSHWLLLIISPKNRTIELLDSMYASGKKWLSIAREWLQMELGNDYDPKEWKELPSRSSQQDNSNDCGVFTCFNALAAAKGKGYEEAQAEDMRDARRLMGAILMNNGFSGDYEL